MLAILVAYPSPELTFTNLTVLHLELLKLTMGETSAQTSISSLAFFMLHLSSSLQTLCILSWLKLDLSHFFSCLSQPLSDLSPLIPFPDLKSLSLIFPFCSLGTSFQPLHRFLLVQSTSLQRLQFWMKMRDEHDTDCLEDVSIERWFADFVDNKSKNDLATRPSSFFTNLQILEIRPPDVGLSFVLSLIKYTAPTLSSLTIRDYALTEKEAKQVVCALTEEGQVRFGAQIQLKSLRIQIQYLDVILLEFLASKLPRLQKLRLDVKTIFMARLFPGENSSPLKYVFFLF